MVVPHTGDVDRNAFNQPLLFVGVGVVPHTGDVDRNIVSNPLITPSRQVVPHTGDVDRNKDLDRVVEVEDGSSPIRGTWIEIGAS